MEFTITLPFVLLPLLLIKPEIAQPAGILVSPSFINISSLLNKYWKKPDPAEEPPDAAIFGAALSRFDHTLYPRWNVLRWNFCHRQVADASLPRQRCLRLYSPAQFVLSAWIYVHIISPYRWFVKRFLQVSFRQSFILLYIRFHYCFIFPISLDYLLRLAPLYGAFWSLKCYFCKNRRLHISKILVNMPKCKNSTISCTIFK